MSHITTVETEIRDLEALKSACAELGAEFVEGQKHYAWYGHPMGDYPIPEGLSKEDLGKCSHAIRLPGVAYEVGVVRKENGNWTLAYDFWGPGQKLQEKFGEGCSRLVQLYAVHKATREARRKGLSVQRSAMANGSIKLVLTSL